jgi:hypothetical protein
MHEMGPKSGEGCPAHGVSTRFTVHHDRRVMVGRMGRKTSPVTRTPLPTKA